MKMRSTRQICGRFSPHSCTTQILNSWRMRGQFGLRLWCEK